MKKYLLILTVFLTFLTEVFASHIPGGNLTWTCTGNPNEYIVTMQLFVSCPRTLSTSGHNISTTNTCGLTDPTIRLDFVSKKEVSQICDRDTAQSDCVTGTTGGIPGVEMYTYSKLVTLPGPCDSWDFSFTDCCRDASTNTNGITNRMHFNSKMYSATAPCDGSPVVTAQPIPYVCAGVQATYCPGAIDPDGDSLVYTLVLPKGDLGVPFNFAAGYSAASPLQNLTLDPITGCITFNQPTAGNFVVVYLIEAYNAAGNLTGYITHDFQFEVIANSINCAPPQAPAAGVTNATGGATITNMNTLEVCVGESFCIDIEFTDPDPMDTIQLDSLSTNIFAAMPGATMTQVGLNPTTFTLCWTVPDSLGNNTQGIIGVSDGSCPIKNLASFPLIIRIKNAATANTPLTICQNQTAQLSATGGTLFTWYYTATGMQIPVSPNFSCNPCANPTVTPIGTGTTSYYVVSNSLTGCNLNDTTTVTVLPNFTISTTPNDTSICVGEKVNFTVTPNVADPAYIYTWHAFGTLNDSSIANPEGTFTSPGVYTVSVDVELPGCTTNSDSMDITVIQPMLPAINLTDALCKDGTNGKIIATPTFSAGSTLQTFEWTNGTSGAVLQNTPGLSPGMIDSLTNLAAGIYNIKVTNSAGCSVDTSVTISEPDSVTIDVITPNDTVCINGSIQISASAIGGSGSGYTYDWIDLSSGTAIPGNGPHNVSPTASPTCYRVIATDANGCVSGPSQTCISVYPNIVASTTNGTKIDTITICPPSADGGPFTTPIEINATGGMGAPYVYTWYDGGTTVGTGNIINVSPPSSPYTYIGVATDNCTTPPDSVWVTIKWADTISPSFTKNRADSCYSAIPINFTNTSSPANLISGTSWKFSDGTTLIGSSPSGIFNSAGCRDLSMTVTTTDGCNFTVDSANYVCPHDYPIANFSVTPAITNVLNTKIEFTNLSTGNNLTHSWIFNSGLSPDTSIATHPTFSYRDDVPGTYVANLTVTSNPDGCVSTTTGTIIINGVYLFYVPNAFSPDGDGINDVFMPSGEGIDLSQYTMLIFDRWGELIYESNDASLGWDGSYKGSMVKTGTYIWKIITKEEENSTIHENIGHVNVLR